MVDTDLTDCPQVADSAEVVGMVGDGTWLSTMEAARVIGCSKSHVIDLVDSRQLPAAKVGNRRRILRTIAEAYRDRLLREATGDE